MFHPRPGEFEVVSFSPVQIAIGESGTDGISIDGLFDGDTTANGGFIKFESVPWSWIIDMRAPQRFDSFMLATWETFFYRAPSAISVSGANSLDGPWRVLFAGSFDELYDTRVVPLTYPDEEDGSLPWCSNPGNCGTFTDTRDAVTYRWTRIGDQRWMAENLRFVPAQGFSTCYDGSSAQCDSHGRLYDWMAAMEIDPVYGNSAWGGGDVRHRGVCPMGWHVPSNSEWDALLEFVDSATESAGYTTGPDIYEWTRVGHHLKAVTNSGTDDFAFSALSSGMMDDNQQYHFLDEAGFFWSATEFGAVQSWGYALWRDQPKVQKWANYMKAAKRISVRCVADD